jgi:Zn-finger nucleic acid-binding protein
MSCPRCQSPLHEIDRDGITIDRCDRCRGIWLDRGELEKLLARQPDSEARAPTHRGDDDDDDDDDRRSSGRGERRRSWWEIFD